MAVTAHWQGPLPPPAALQAFDAVVENGASRIFAEWESETSHRRIIEKRALTAQIWENILSRVFAFVFAGGALCGAIYLGTQGHDWLAGVIATSTIGLVIGGYLGTRGRKE